MKGTVTLQTIADHLGISRGTVSLALRNYPRISKRTRERVFRAAKKLGYRPNPMVASLMAHLSGRRQPDQQQIIAFLTSFKTRHGWREWKTIARYHQGAKKRAAELGFKLEDFWLGEKGMSSRRMSDILSNRGIHGVFVAPLEQEGGEINLDWDRFAAATAAYSVTDHQVDRVTPNYHEAVSMAVDHVRQLGYRRIGLALVHSGDQRSHGWILSSFMGTTYRYAKKDFVPPLIHHLWEKEEFAKWFQRHRPEVIFTSTDKLLEWLGEMKFKVPEDVGLVKLNRFPDSEFAGVDMVPERVGSTIIDQIVGRIYRNEMGASRDSTVVLIEGEWRDGTTLREINSTT